MTALSQDRKTDQVDTPDTVTPRLIDVPIKDNVKVYAGGIGAVNSSGYAVAASADNTLKIIGRIEASVDNTIAGHAAGLFNVRMRRGAFRFNIGATTIADLGKLCYVVDDNTVSTDDGAGLRPAAGVIVEIASSTSVGVLLGVPSLYQESPQADPGGAAYKVRGVLTSVAAYTVVAGVITANANGAIGAQDGLTLVAGQQVLMGADTAATAADEGPYVVTSPGGAGKFVLTRPDWWYHGMVIPDGAVIEVGSEGTANAGSSWKCFAAGPAKVVGTDTPHFWPRTQGGEVTIGGGGTVDTVGAWIRLAAPALGATEITDATKTFKGVVTQGIKGTGKVTFTGTAADHLLWNLSNW